jgi:uncharacterized Zn finger protein
MSFFWWGPKPSVAQQRAKAEKLLARMGKARALSPVVIEGNKIASSFWGKAWCDNLERYSDYANRLPRGRSYVRNRCVVDLQIASGEVTAEVSGSSLYRITITVAPLDDKAWRDICRDCSGSIDSMVELLQGRLSKAVMDRVCRAGDGLFPPPKSIKLACSCPDGAYMCKHVAATLYGVGARLDRQPDLLFVLRGVDQQQLIQQASTFPGVAAGTAPANTDKVLGDADLASLFGLDIDQPATPAEKNAKTSARTNRQSASDCRLANNSSKSASNPKGEARAGRAKKGKATKQSRSEKSTKSPSPGRRQKNQVLVSAT